MQPIQEQGWEIKYWEPDTQLSFPDNAEYWNGKEWIKKPIPPNTYFCYRVPSSNTNNQDNQQIEQEKVASQIKQLRPTFCQTNIQDSYAAVIADWHLQQTAHLQEQLNLVGCRCSGLLPDESVYYSKEHDNYYCSKCKKGMGVQYYQAASQRDRLQEQLQLKESVVGRCVEVLKKIDDNLLGSHFNYAMESRRIIEQTLKKLPSTPNYVKRVEELNQLLVRLANRFIDVKETIQDPLIGELVTVTSRFIAETGYTGEQQPLNNQGGMK